MDRCERAREIVADARRALDGAAARLPGEEAQAELYDLAFSSAELTAAEIMLEYAAHDAPPGERAFKEALALTYCAEAASNLQHRLRLRPQRLWAERGRTLERIRRFCRSVPVSGSSGHAWTGVARPERAHAA